jgi:small subunit ribosomal protein S9
MTDETQESAETTPPPQTSAAKEPKPKAQPPEPQAAAPKEPPKPKVQPPEPQVPTRTAPPLPDGTMFLWGTGRRKKAVARVRIRPGAGGFIINRKSVQEYFPHLQDQEAVVSPLKTLGMLNSYDIWVNVHGGGWTGQAGAVTLGLARALAKHMPDVESDLRDKGLLTRDARMKERKKPGQPGARKRFQFSKR